MSSAGLSRRTFLIAGAAAAGGLAVGVGYGRRPRADAAPSSVPLNAILVLDEAGMVTITIPRAEMGQGTYTSLAMLAAEEMDLPWSHVQVAHAPADRAYANMGPLWRPDALPNPILMAAARVVGGFQVTGGSMSMRDGWIVMRTAGAGARAMLMAAGAEHWGVTVAEVTTSRGAVVRKSDNTTLAYGSLAAAAAKQKAPSAPSFRDPRDYVLVGKSIPRVDTPAKVRGTAEFGIDVRIDGMLHAAVRNAPAFGGKVARLDRAAIAKYPGVVAVVMLPGAAAVIADSTWHARSALELASNSGEIVFEPGASPDLSSEGIFTDLARNLESEVGKSITDVGDAAKVLGSGPRAVTAEYRVPFLAHACMEPMNATARLKDGHLDVWLGTQVPDFARDAAASAAGVAERNTTIHNLYLGGGFGRRAEEDLPAQVGALAKAVPGKAVKLVWTREEDIQHDFYRPAAIARIAAAFAPDGSLLAWRTRVAAPAMLGTYMRRTLGIPIGTLADRGEVGDAIHPRYRVPNLAVEWVPSPTPVPTGSWRSVSNSYGAFFTESFVDELAHDTNTDPYLFRRNLLDGSPRHRAVLDLAAQKANWGRVLVPGEGRGIAIHECFGSIVAEVVEVHTAGGKVVIDRIVAAVDCGLPINPAGIEAQVESAIYFGLTAALYGEITVRAGRVEQSNFHDYEMLRIDEAPRIETYLAPAGGPLGGVGEVATPPVAPALANAIFSATGKRIRTLPLRNSGLI